MWCPHPLVTSEGTLQVIKIRGIPTTSSFGLSYAKREARERGVKPSGSTQGCERVQHYAHFVDLRFQAIRIAEVQSFAKALSSRSFESKFYSSSGTLPKTI
ncbi:hypothetical protein CMV_003548 [Castanea mollissima]|uniref:Uncharacterized protein n=1 Tax=Castanea mollissima TaxID=60419 RepID=A0A8J4W2X2_9ROSI|nr:hypothetical protein CMV_003548 [Castanea mollissima]